MVDPQTSRFWQAALQSGLVDVAGLKSCWEALPPEKQVADQLERRLARQAVQGGLLTVWQAQQLLAGRSTGFKINRYVLLDMIGQGGMGRVYLARDSRLNRRVALKILSPERVNNPRAIARFQREARVGAQLQHENLVRIYDEGESNGKCYLVMEFIEGRNIGSLIGEKGPIPPSTAARLVRQVALGLEHAQLKGLIHRDVNPYNILVTSDGTAKLTDLGLAIDLAEQVPVTREGATVGTFDYISPEQARHSHSVDTRSDIYSLGCTLYHMLAGQVPFPSPSLPEKLFGHQASEPTPLTEVVPAVPEGLAAVVARMMRKLPDERYASPLDVAQALEPFIDELGPAYRSESLAGSQVGLATSTSTPASGPTLSGTHVSDGSRAVPGSNSSARPRPAAVSARAETRADDLPADLAALIPDVPPTLDLSGLAQTLDFGPVPSLSEGLSTARAKPKPAPPPPPPAPEPDASPAAVDFSVIGKEPAPKLDLSGLGLALDFGPEPPLSGTSVKPKPPAAPAPVPAPAAETKASARPQPAAAAATEAPDVPRLAVKAKPARGMSLVAVRGQNRAVLAAAAAVALIAGVGGLFASGVLGKSRPPRPAQSTPRTGAGSASKPVEPSGDDVASAAPSKGHPRPADDGPAETQGKAEAKGADVADVARGTTFKVRAADGTVATETSLKSAMQRAIGSRGHVLLDNRAPLRLAGADAAIHITGGRLSIRAAEGTRPVIEVEMKGPKPFLATGAETPLVLDGVTIVAHYAETNRTPQPVIEAGAGVTLERSAFVAAGPAKVSGTRAVKVQGATVTATGCWFQGFDCAIDITALSGATATIKECMIVWGRSEGPPSGFAVRVQAERGGRVGAGRRLHWERSTVDAAGLVDLVGFSPQMPCTVTVKGCAVRADALVAWEPTAAGTLPAAEALQWSGQGNQYDVQGKAWIVAAPQGAAPLADSPHDAASWAKLASEDRPIMPPVTFATNPDERGETLDPKDFALKDGAGTVGADAAKVGPGAKSVRRP